MPPLKTSYTELTHRVVRESREPLPFDEITRRVSAIEPITTKNPKGTIRNAISQSRLIVNTGDARYGWKYRVIKGSVLRLTLSELDCQGKVTLRDSHPAIWRRLQVGDNVLLPQLHGILQLAMGWTNSHLHSFQVGKQTFAEPSPDDFFPVVDYRTVRLSQIAPKVKDHFVYLYDFGDRWEHDIVVERIFPPEKDVDYPRCLDGRRACPPEDVGGVWGYADFVKAIRNPRHPEHDEMLAWAGGQFDPEKFDLNAVNGMLSVFQSTLAYRVRRKR